MSLFKSIFSQYKKEKVDWDAIEEILIRSDIGVRMAMRIIRKLEKNNKKVSEEEAMKICREEILSIFQGSNKPKKIIPPLINKPVVIFVVGVNGTGKTTSSAKLAHYLQTKVKGKAVLAAADTYRAAAIEQLQTWGERLDIPVITGNYKADPSSVCFTAYEFALKNFASFLICDTAGRQHTKSNLMEELKKIKRVLNKKDSESPHHSLVVVDATTGLNALNQAQEFHSAVGLDGFIMTKLDGSGKGGSAVAIAEKLKIRPYFIGTGESVENFLEFGEKKYVQGLL